MADVHSVGFAGDRAARSALNTVHHFVGLLDVDGTVLEVNSAALAAGGLERDDVVGLPFWKTRWWGHDPEVQSTLRDAVRRAANGETVQYPVEVLAADAGRSLVTIDFRLSPVRESDGSITFLVPEGHPLGEGVAGEEDATASLSTLVADGSTARNEARDLRELAAGLAQAYTVDDVASVVIGRIPDVIGVEFCNVAVLDDAASVLIHQPSELDRNVRSRWSRVPIDASSPATDAIRDGRVHVCVNRDAVARQYPDLVDDLATSGLESIAAVPIVGAEGRAVAAIGLGASTEFGIDLDWARPVLDLCGAALQRAMATQRESRLAALLDTLIRTAPIGFAFVDSELRCTLVNDRLAEVFGSSADGHLPRSLGDVVPDLADQIVPYVRSVLHDGTAVEAVDLAGEVGESRAERMLTASFYPIHGADRSVTGVGLIVEDMTEQRRQQSELASLAARVRAALAASDGGVYEWNPPTGTVVWTAEYADLYGFADDVEPSFDAWISRVHPDDRDRVVAEVEQFLSDDIEWRHEFRLEHPERGTLWVQSVADTARDDAGTVVRVTGLNIDVTERKQRELEIARLHREQRLLAERLQTGLLPGELPGVVGYELIGRYRAGTDGLRVGGDWYDVIAIDDDDIALVIGDIVGHDLDAAIGMAQLRHALVGISHTRKDPEVVLSDVDHVTAQNPSLLASTLWYARLQPSTGRLVYASAGHHAPVVVDDEGRIESLDGGLGPPIGASRGKRGQSEAVLPPGADLLAFTDGLIERRDESIETSRERLITQLASRHEAPLADVVDGLLRTIPGPRNNDDIAMLALRRGST